MSDWTRKGRELRPQDRDALKRKRIFAQRMLVMNIVTVAFFMAAVIYFVLLGADLLKPPASEPPTPGQTPKAPDPIYWILMVVTVVEIPVMYFMVNHLLKPMESAKSFAQVAGLAFTGFIVGLAFCESMIIYGLISVFLGATKPIAYGMMGFGLVVMACTVFWLRTWTTNAMLGALQAELKQP